MHKARPRFEHKPIRLFGLVVFFSAIIGVGCAYFGSVLRETWTQVPWEVFDPISEPGSAKVWRGGVIPDATTLCLGAPFARHTVKHFESAITNGIRCGSVDPATGRMSYEDRRAPAWVIELAKQRIEPATRAKTWPEDQRAIVFEAIELGQSFQRERWLFAGLVAWAADVVGSAILAAFLFELGLTAQAHRRRRRRTLSGACPSCGYATAGLKGPVCPECGAAVVVDRKP